MAPQESDRGSERESGRQEKGAEPRAGAPRQDAVALLTRDHREVEVLFQRFKTAGDEGDRSALARRICLMLKAHTRIEEEIFYPAARRRIEDKDLVEEALEEHKAAKDLIEEIESTDLDDPLFGPRMQQLSDIVDHHVREEENELFPEVREAQIDLMGLGARLAELKMEVMRELGLDAEADPLAEPPSFERRQD